MIKPYIKNETAVDIICSICDRMYPGMDCEPADCEWMKMLAEEAVDAGRWSDAKTANISTPTITGWTNGNIVRKTASMSRRIGFANPE